MTSSSNPLLGDEAVPRFDAITPVDVAPAIATLIERCEQALEQATLPGVPADHELLARVLDVPLQALEDAWGVVVHLQSVADSPELRAAFAAAQPAVTALYTRIGADERLFALYRRVAQECAARMSGPQRKALADSLRAFRLAGAELDPGDKTRFAAIQQRAAELGRGFSNRLLDATDAFVHWASAAELAGVPDDVLAPLRAAAQRDGRDGVFKLNLQQPCVGPVLRYADDRTLRETLYRAQTTRASEFGPADLDNSALIAEMLRLRHEKAALLGYANHAEVSLVPKMADSPAQVLEFLRDLARRCRPQAERDLAELRAFAAAELGLPALQAWDLAYASEKLRQARYAFSEQDVKRHFGLDKVLPGLFGIAETLFDVRIQEEAQTAWHPAVRAFRVERAGELLGRFFLDPYARAGKRGGAWMNGARARWRKPDGALRTALAYLVTNFAAPTDGKPGLMSHDDVVTLFHEFGHGLHFLLSQVDVPGVSGISGVEWDAVELPSQLMENFAWEWSTLQRISAHVDTGAPLPRALYDKMLAARNFQSGLQLSRQVELALFDMRLHAEPARSEAVQALVDEVRAEAALLSPPAYNRFQNGFSHIFAGGYSAGYYSYLWAEVLAADAWSVFERAGALDQAVGRRYRETILEVGGSRTMNESFVAFVGREPEIGALLRQRGIAQAA